MHLLKINVTSNDPYISSEVILCLTNHQIAVISIFDRKNKCSSHVWCPRSLAVKS
jgi:hypothetical protein